LDCRDTRGLAMRLIIANFAISVRLSRAKGESVADFCLDCCQSWALVQSRGDPGRQSGGRIFVCGPIRRHAILRYHARL
jgi:hypothetical protein